MDSLKLKFKIKIKNVWIVMLYFDFLITKNKLKGIFIRLLNNIIY